MGWINPGTLGTLIPLVALMIPIVAIIAGVIEHRHNESERHETMRQLAKSGQPIPVELLRNRRQRRSDESPSSPRPAGSASLRAGLVLTALGLGIASTLFLVIPESTSWAWGLIPAFIGVAYLVLWRIESTHPPAA
jgi:hypothetical protein